MSAETAPLTGGGEGNDEGIPPPRGESATIAKAKAELAALGKAHFGLEMIPWAKLDALCTKYSPYRDLLVGAVREAEEEAHRNPARATKREQLRRDVEEGVPSISGYVRPYPEDMAAAWELYQACKTQVERETQAKLAGGTYGGELQDVWDEAEQELRARLAAGTQGRELQDAWDKGERFAAGGGEVGDTNAIKAYYDAIYSSELWSKEAAASEALAREAAAAAARAEEAAVAAEAKRVERERLVAEEAARIVAAEAAASAQAAEAEAEEARVAAAQAASRRMHRKAQRREAQTPPNDKIVQELCSQFPHQGRDFVMQQLRLAGGDKRQAQRTLTEAERHRSVTENERRSKKRRDLVYSSLLAVADYAGWGYLFLDTVANLPDSEPSLTTQEMSPTNGSQWDRSTEPLDVRSSCVMAYSIRMANNESDYSYAQVSTADLSDLSAEYSQDAGCITAYWRPASDDCTPPSCHAELQHFCVPYGAVEDANESWGDLLFLMKMFGIFNLVVIWINVSYTVSAVRHFKDAILLEDQSEGAAANTGIGDNYVPGNICTCAAAGLYVAAFVYEIMLFVAWDAELETTLVDQGDSGETELALCADNAAFQQANTLVQTRLYYRLSGIVAGFVVGDYGIVACVFFILAYNHVKEDESQGEMPGFATAFKCATQFRAFVKLTIHVGWVIYLIVEIAT